MIFIHCGSDDNNMTTITHVHVWFHSYTIKEKIIYI
jgi:hypothetical protein